jgi:hypothetical protein
MSKFQKIVESFLLESLSNGVLERPLKKVEVAKLNSGEDVVIDITPDRYLNKFTIAPYDNEEDMQSMRQLHSETMDGDFTYNIKSVDWSIGGIRITVTTDEVDNVENGDLTDDQVNADFEALVGGSEGESDVAPEVEPEVEPEADPEAPVDGEAPEEEPDPDPSAKSGDKPNPYK